MEYTFVLAVGLIAGAVSGIIGTGSSIMLVPVLVYQFGPKEAVPIFLMYGLTKGAFLATEGAGSLAIYVAKVLAFRGFGAMPVDTFIKGLITGSSLMAGTFIAKRFVLKLDADSFRYMLDGLMLVSGLAMLWNASTT